MITETVKFMTEKVPVFLYRDGVSVISEIATVIWTTDEEWRSWGLKSIGVTVEKVIIDYDVEIENDEGDIEHRTEEFTEDIEVIRDNTIPLYPQEVEIRDKKVTVDFGGY